MGRSCSPSASASEMHRASSMRKLHFQTRAQLVNYATASGSPGPAGPLSRNRRADPVGPQQSLVAGHSAVVSFFVPVGPGTFSGAVGTVVVLVAGHFPGALAHRRLAEPELRRRPAAASGVVLGLLEREPGGARRHAHLPAAAARVALPELVHVRPRLLRRRVFRQRRPREVVPEVPLVSPARSRSPGRRS